MPPDEPKLWQRRCGRTTKTEVAALLKFAPLREKQALTRAGPGTDRNTGRPVIPAGPDASLSGTGARSFLLTCSRSSFIPQILFCTLFHVFCIMLCVCVLIVCNYVFYCSIWLYVCRVIILMKWTVDFWWPESSCFEIKMRLLPAVGMQISDIYRHFLCKPASISTNTQHSLSRLLPEMFSCISRGGSELLSVLPISMPVHSQRCFISAVLYEHIWGVAVMALKDAPRFESGFKDVLDIRTSKN